MQVDIVTTTVEVQETVAGEVTEVVNEQVTQDVIGEPAAVNGISEVPIQEQVQIEPQLFDMDLERMHIDLYREKYLTADDFLDDIRKIVHNTEVRADEDAERMLRAQAMFTAARLSLSDIDAHFRLECDRMAARERKRRDERRKARGKEKAADQGTAPGIRRSGRTNGQEPELTITDPVQLERRLKRARSAETGQTPSEDERDREAKRSRMGSAEGEGEQQVPSTPHRPHAVRFMDDPTHPLPAPNFLDVPEAGPSTLTPSSQSRNRSDIGSLLNPIPSPERPSQDADVLPELPPDDSTLALQQVGPAPTQLFMDNQPSLPETSSHSQIPQTPLPDIPQTGDVPMEASPSQRPDPPAEAPPPQDEPMEVFVREPTPLPDFVLDETGLSALRDHLRDSTHSLNIEQLEQLRASCLSTVWRHRAEWDRTSLLHELRTLVDNFVDDVRVDDSFSS